MRLVWPTVKTLPRHTVTTVFSANHSDGADLSVTGHVKTSHFGPGQNQPP